MTPNPIILAAVAGRRFPDAQIGVFGTDLPLNNPVRIAEEYSMLDNLLDGRLRIGMLRGTPNEYLTYGSIPWESRERYESGAFERLLEIRPDLVDVLETQHKAGRRVTDRIATLWSLHTDRQAVALLAPSEKMPFQVAPIIPYLKTIPSP